MADTHPRRPHGILRTIAPVVVFLLRLNCIKPLNDYLMVITHTGHKTGKHYTNPIAYARDGETFLAFSIGGIASWYHNVQENPEVTLEVSGDKLQARAQLVSDPADLEKVLDVYKVVHRSQYRRYFGVPLDMPTDQAARSPQLFAKFVRFHPVHS
jgi:deazaflavin-dependent oxidoreductase (nitroreductase family)